MTLKSVTRPSSADTEQLAMTVVAADGSDIGTGGSVGALKVYSTDNTAGNTGYGKIDASQRVVIAGSAAATPVPVAISTIAGVVPTLTVDNLNVQLTHLGANPDSVQIGDGTETLGVNTDGSINTDSIGKSVVETIRNDYSSVNVTTGAWVELIASTSGEINWFDIFDSSGETLELGTGAAASEARLILITPGGNDNLPVNIPASTRVSIKAVSANATVGEIDINFLS